MRFTFIILFIGLFQFQANAQYELGMSSLDEHDDHFDACAPAFILKTSPFDFFLGRIRLAGEYQFTQKSSVELSLMYDYLRQTDFIYGNVSDFGHLYKISARYKRYPSWGQKWVSQDNPFCMNGIFYAFGIEAGQSPLLYARNESVFEYVSNVHEERSTFGGALADIGYAWWIKRWHFECFIGMNARYNSRARSSEWNTETEELIYEYAALFAPDFRFGVRVGYRLF